VTLSRAYFTVVLSVIVTNVVLLNDVTLCDHFNDYQSNKINIEQFKSQCTL
jgi:hypothetical protein